MIDFIVFATTSAAMIAISGVLWGTIMAALVALLVLIARCHEEFTK